MPNSPGGPGRPPNNGSGPIKVTLHKNRKDSDEWSTASAKRRSKKLPTSPVSPNLQYLLDNQPQLLPANIQFQYNTNESADNNETSTAYLNDAITPTSNSNTNTMDIDNVMINTSDLDIHNKNTPNKVNIDSDTVQSSTLKKITNNSSEDSNLKSFSNNFNGTPIILVESTVRDQNIGKLHPLKIGKLFHNKFGGIKQITPIGSRVKILFDSIKSANACLNSNLLTGMNLKASIPSTLIYSHGIIRLETSTTEEEFWEGIESPVPIIGFRRIVTKRDSNTPTQTNLVELKFLSSKLPEKLLIFKVIFTVSPSIRSPVICNKCLRYGHTAKFCRSKARCARCGANDHIGSDCPNKDISTLSCVHCKGSHEATDRACPEWSRQKEIKKIMAVENISYNDATFILKNNIVNKTKTYSDSLSNNVNTINNSSASQNPISLESFPSLSQPYTQKNKNKYLHYKNNSQPVIPHSVANKSNDWSSPNGSFLEYMSSNTYAQPAEKSWITSLANQLSSAVFNTPSTLSSPSTLNQLIESHILNFLSSSSRDSVQ
ncbi:uncharacterized protein LOC126909010 [Daktulosphaira vitifoliae]|uniref:uncharacterized protein LOC126909010 n=1 Tax=Daktulosphaira vitifoliae TaxID=58002 RepID=UPI0021A9C312|nr:uncharacterized protein LOC126909010 [Daktulosphaira vitifoliae]